MTAIDGVFCVVVCLRQSFSVIISEFLIFCNNFYFVQNFVVLKMLTFSSDGSIVFDIVANFFLSTR